MGTSIGLIARVLLGYVSCYPVFPSKEIAVRYSQRE